MTLARGAKRFYGAGSTAAVMLSRARKAPRFEVVKFRCASCGETQVIMVAIGRVKTACIDCHEEHRITDGERNPADLSK